MLIPFCLRNICPFIRTIHEKFILFESVYEPCFSYERLFNKYKPLNSVLFHLNTPNFINVTQFRTQPKHPLERRALQIFTCKIILHRNYYTFHLIMYPFSMITQFKLESLYKSTICLAKCKMYPTNNHTNVCISMETGSEKIRRVYLSRG